MEQSGNDRLLRALRRQAVDRTPAWLMRQAGRYLPEYREVRNRAGSFLALCTTPELACRVTLQPLERFPLDAAIVFSDILTIPHAMGLGLEFVEGEGPRFARPVRDAAAIDRLPQPDPEDDLGYVMETLRLARRALDGRVPLIGFAGSPWTVGCYMIEGRSGSDFRLAKQMLFAAPGELHRLLGTLAAVTTEYLRAQIAAGAQAVMIFDTWGGILTTRDYREFSLAYSREIFAALSMSDPEVPTILFTKGGGGWLEDMAASGCSAVGLDWSTDLGVARARVGDRVALQGNLDPAVLRAPAPRLQAEVEAVLESFGSGSGHVFNLGHGIFPDVDPDQVALVLETVRRVSERLHA